jgi:dienelactone hydrolase
VKRTLIVWLLPLWRREDLWRLWNSLKKQKSIDPERIAAIGYCFGGVFVKCRAKLAPEIGYK